MEASGWFDSHCHVQEAYLEGEEGSDPEADLGSVLAGAVAAGVDRLVCIGTGAATSRQAVALARALVPAGSSPRAWASIGLHPHEASDGVDDVATLLATECRRGDGTVVAVGECGLDYYYEHSPREPFNATCSPRRSRWHTHTISRS